MNEDRRRKRQQGHNDSSNWIWGIFYYNPQDKRLFIPKRIPVMGWTINLANTTPFLVITAIVIAVIILIEYLK